jgi:hypothetical protein
MARLTTAARKSEPAKDFGLPAQRKYPMPDKAHAANAKARASEMEHKGRLSPAQEKQIDAKADRRLASPDRRGESNKNRAADRVVARVSRPKAPK